MCRVLLTSTQKCVCLIIFPKTYLSKETSAFKLFFPSGSCELRLSAFPSTTVSLWTYAAYTSELGETCSLAPNFKGVAYRACLEPLSGVAGSKMLTRNPYLGSASCEIKLLTKWNSDCAAGATTCLSGNHKLVTARRASVRVREPEPQLWFCLRTFQACVFAGT